MDKNSDEITQNYECDMCGITFSTRWNLERHKNKKNKCIEVNSDKSYECDNCGKLFKKKQHLENHLNKKNQCINSSFIVSKVEHMIKQRQEDVIYQQEEIVDRMMHKLKNENMNLSIGPPNIATNENLHNTTNNTQNTNSHNTNSHNSNTMNNMSNSYLIQYVINQYPNAKNIEDCIKIENIPKMTLTECEDLYFTDGAMKIFKGLCDLGEENRPIHCTDASRCNYIYKSNDVWKIDVGGEAIRNHFFPVIQDAYTQVHKKRIKDNPGNSSIIGNYLTEMTGANVKKICQKTLKRLTNDFLAKNSKKYKLIKMQERSLTS
jgi:uncharacterized C2H2 Zn-finger protein